LFKAHGLFKGKVRRGACECTFSGLGFCYVKDVDERIHLGNFFWVGVNRAHFLECSFDSIAKRVFWVTENVELWGSYDWAQSSRGSAKAIIGGVGCFTVESFEVIIDSPSQSLAHVLG